MNTYRIGVVGGDGIGPEVAAEAVKVLREVQDGFALEFIEYPFGSDHYLQTREFISEAAFEGAGGAGRDQRRSMKIDGAGSTTDLPFQVRAAAQVAVYRPATAILSVSSGKEPPTNSPGPRRTIRLPPPPSV